MKSSNRKIICSTLLFLWLVVIYGCSSLSTVKLKPDSNFDKKDSIMFYIIPTGDSFLDDTYARVLSLDFMARGYKVVNANRLIKESSDLINVTNHRHIADILFIKSYLPQTSAYIIVQPKWDSTYVLTYYDEAKFARWIQYRFSGMYVPTLISSVTFYDRTDREPIKSYTAIDTTLVYLDSDESKLYYTDFSWMVIAKQLSRELSDVPICSIVDKPTSNVKLNVSFWVDNSYRNAFPNSWKDRIKLRSILANDILRQQFNIELIISEFIEWDSEFKFSLENTLNKLNRNSASNLKKLQIAITLDSGLKSTWESKSKLGLAMLLSNNAAITAQPSFQSIAQYWNPIEEAITIVHEVGHLLGANHVEDNKSIMYPSSGYLSYEFDDINLQIIEATKNKFFNVSNTERVQNYFQELNELRKSQAENHLEILESAGDAFTNLLLNSYSLLDDQKKFTSLILSVSPDSAFAFATKGYIEFKNNQLKQSKKSFFKSIELDSNFTEVKKYLAKIPETIQVDQFEETETNISNSVKADRKISSAATKKRK